MSDKQRICVVGSGWRFVSGISYYTCRLANALSGEHEVSAILMRQLLPTRLYPGRARVGHDIVALRYDDDVKVFDGIDWFWLPSMLRAIAFLRRQKPDTLVLQWWTGTVLHSYLVLAWLAKRMGARVVIEFHEVLDSGEAARPLAHFYVKQLMGRLLRQADGFVVHSDFDRVLLESAYGLKGRPMVTAPHGPFDHYAATEGGEDFVREAPDDVTNVLFFGTIRPYKGLEDLVRAYDALDDETAQRLWLTVVGETWEGHTLPTELIAASPRRDRITFVNHYVDDAFVRQVFDAADAVALPYLRSSASGPLHVAMSHGLPVVVTEVGGLVEAAQDYAGVIFVPPGDVAAIGAALHSLPAHKGQRFDDPHSWARTTEAYAELLAGIGTADTA